MTSLAAAPDEPLPDGTGSATPVGDNLLMDFLRAEAAAYSALVVAQGGRTAHEEQLDVHLADMGAATPFGNVAMLSRPLTEDERTQLAQTLVEFFGAGTGGPFAVFSPWPIGNLAQEGFSPIGHPPLMLRPPSPAPEIAPDLRVIEARDADTLADAERTLVEGYPVPELQPWEPATYYAPAALETPWRFFVGYEDDLPVATAAAYVMPELTLVEFVAARKDVRGKGYGAALTVAATLAEPTNPAMLISSDDGRPVYDRLGYLPLLRYTLWLGPR